MPLYDSRAVRAVVAGLGARAMIPANPTRKHPVAHDPALYQRRNRIERCFNKLKHFRRIATRYDRRAAHFLASSISPLPCSGRDECRSDLVRFAEPAHQPVDIVGIDRSDLPDRVRFEGDVGSVTEHEVASVW